MDGIYLRRNWGGEYENVAILVAIAVNEDGYREVLGAAEGMKEDKASWVNFFQWLKSRGLDGVKLVVGDKCLGMLEAVGEVFPDAKYQRCTVHFYRNVFSVVPRSKVKLVAKMLTVDEWDGVPGSARGAGHRKQYFFKDKAEALTFANNAFPESVPRFDLSVLTDEEWNAIRPRTVLEERAEREGKTLREKVIETYGYIPDFWAGILENEKEIFTNGRNGNESRNESGYGGEDGRYDGDRSAVCF